MPLHPGLAPRRRTARHLVRRRHRRVPDDHASEGPLTVRDDGFTCTLAARVLSSASANQFDATERHLTLDGDTLTTGLAMAAVGVPMTGHLTSELRRVRRAAGARR